MFKEEYINIKFLKDEFPKIGDRVIVIEKTYTNEVFEWDGEITKIENNYIETKHKRNPVTHPQWMSYFRAYNDTWTKHYK